MLLLDSQAGDEAKLLHEYPEQQKQWWKLPLSWTWTAVHSHSHGRFQLYQHKRKSCRRSAPSVCHQGVNKVTLVMPWCDMSTFPLTVELCVKIGWFEMAHKGISSEKKKNNFFFFLWWDEIYFSWTLNLLNFLFYSFHLWKILSFLLPYASFSKIFPANLSFCSRDFTFTDEWHQNCSIWSFMAFSDSVGLLIIYCVWDLALWLKCHLESTRPLLGRAGARKIKFEKRKMERNKKLVMTNCLGKVGSVYE